jgi:S-adenosylmethionine:tRNA ribosyltransferase-isomerase
MRTEELDFYLPPELIAQDPPPERAASRLLHYRRDDRSIAHRRFSDLPALLSTGDLLVFNDARVLPARFTLLKTTGGKIEGLFLEELALGRWRVLLKNPGPPRADGLRFVDALDVRIDEIDRHEGGEHTLAIDPPLAAATLLDRVGRMPLPPYIKRKKTHDPRDAADRERYQTVYAKASGSVAAPTAGLHFTARLLEELGAAGVEMTQITLHVGMGTFRPVVADDLAEHVMHRETYRISAQAAEALNRARAQGRRIIAVGTTSARVLESQEAGRPFEARDGATSIFIHPPYAWRHVEGLITNFHLPRSTLIALVAALTGIDEQRRIYAAAIADRYRFFSYGDAMLIE